MSEELNPKLSKIDVVPLVVYWSSELPMLLSNALFVWLISHDRKYCWLIYCERKILLNN